MPNPAFFFFFIWQRSEMCRNKSDSVLSHLAAQFTRDWMKQKHGETLSSLLLLRWKGDSFLTCPTHLTGTVISAFPVHAHPSLMSLCGHLQNDPERPASATSLLGPGAHYWDLLGLGPHLDYEWESSKKAMYAPSGSNTRSGSAARAGTCVVVSFFQQHEEPDLM